MFNYVQKQLIIITITLKLINYIQFILITIVNKLYYILGFPLKMSKFYILIKYIVYEIYLKKK